MEGSTMVSGLSGLEEGRKVMGEGRPFPDAPRPSPFTHLSLWIPVALWAGFIFYLSSVPNLRFMKNDLLDFVVRKVGHMGVFGILARLFTRALTGSTWWSWKKIFTASLVLTFLYACSDEYHQAYVPGRHPSSKDVAIDTFGAWLALGLKP